MGCIAMASPEREDKAAEIPTSFKSFTPLWTSLQACTALNCDSLIALVHLHPDISFHIRDPLANLELVCISPGYEVKNL